jgi:hypothetical protein
MRLPQFTAEASLRNKQGSYILASGPSADTGRVLPQFIHPHCGCFPLRDGGIVCNCV